MAKKSKCRSKSKSRRSNRRSRSNRNRNRNRSRRHNQQGGMSDWSATGDYMLLGPDARMSAQVGSLDSAFGELPSVIPQRGGRRNRSRKNKRTLSRKRNHSRRNQQGGMAPFGDTGRMLSSAQYAADGTNPQFRTEMNVNERYSGF